MVGNFFGKPLWSHTCKKNWSKTGHICKKKCNYIKPHRVNSLVLVSEVVRNFGGIKYKNKAPVQNIFLKMYLEKCEQSQKKAYSHTTMMHPTMRWKVQDMKRQYCLQYSNHHPDTTSNCQVQHRLGRIAPGPIG